MPLVLDAQLDLQQFHRSHNFILVSPAESLKFKYNLIVSTAQFFGRDSKRILTSQGKQKGNSN